MTKKAERDVRFDTLKGIAILIVMVGHVIQNATQEFTRQTAYNFIWAIQMPLFMILSGYFSAGRIRPLPAYLCNKLCRYLVPFFSFTLIRSLYKGWEGGAYWKGLPWHVDSSLWYLYVLFVLSLMQYAASRVAARCATPQGGGTACHGFVSVSNRDLGNNCRILRQWLFGGKIYSILCFVFLDRLAVEKGHARHKFCAIGRLAA